MSRLYKEKKPPINVIQYTALNKDDNNITAFTPLEKHHLMKTKLLSTQYPVFRENNNTSATTSLEQAYFIKTNLLRNPVYCPQ